MPIPIFAGMAVLGGGYWAYRALPRILERYAQMHPPPPVGRLAYRSYETAFQREMTHPEAMRILGFCPDTEKKPPTDRQVKMQFRQLMSKYHTDVGGSPLLSQKLNEAKELLSPRR